MQQTLITIGMLAGGLGLFMLAVTMITDGLKLATGQALREILAKSTRSPVHGVFTGLVMTAIIQSSSAVTVATIGFVNAGLVSMRQALGIVYGSNIGTTMTGWLVAIIGFKVNIDSFALPLIGIGMLMRLTGEGSKRAPLGLALVGFGLFFVGIDVLKDAFDGLMTDIDLTRFTVEGVSGVIIYVGLGFLMTVLTQSSSAAIAITLTAATGGVLGLYAAAAMVIGANVGTTSTAALSVIGATSNAMRVASAHIIFNLGTGLVALLTLPMLFYLVQSSGELLGLEANPAVTLALFHTVFNILGVLLILPFNNRLADFLEQRFITQDEIEGRPRFLDRTIAASPAIAINALAKELSRMTSIVGRIAKATVDSSAVNLKRSTNDHAVVHALAAEVSKFVSRIQRATLSEEVADQLAKLLRTEQHLLACAEQAVVIVAEHPEMSLLNDQGIVKKMNDFHGHAAQLISTANPEADDFLFADCDRQLKLMQVIYEDLKATLLSAGAGSKIPVPLMIELVDHNSRVRRMSRQLFKALALLNELSFVAETKGDKSTRG